MAFSGKLSSLYLSGQPTAERGGAPAAGCPAKKRTAHRRERLRDLIEEPLQRGESGGRPLIADTAGDVTVTVQFSFTYHHGTR